MISDVDLIRLVSVLYGDGDPAGLESIVPRREPPPLPAFSEIVETPLIRAGIVRKADRTYVIFPGSKSFLDWWEDGDAVPVHMGALGPVHAGFMAGVMLAKAKLDKAVSPYSTDPPLTLVGHSLGAAHAMDYAALRLAQGHPVREIVAFGCPMPGCSPMRQSLAPVVIRNYRNGSDPVPDVPAPWWGYPCVQMREFTMLDGKPDEGDASVFAFHHARCYWRGLTNGD